MSTQALSPLSAGMRFHDRYEIVCCLKAGGMGAVYECVHLATQKRRALKLMLPQLLTTAGMRERFDLEARVTARIESDHIVETFDAGVDEATGAPFLVMELLRGKDLDSILRSDGPFTVPETVVLLAQAALALDKTHAAGIVHRDLKPQNLFLTTRDDGSPRLKILDFGIAKVVADGTKAAEHTAALGTPVYMAPEQSRGDGTIGAPADLYALGHIAYALLVGEAYWKQEQQRLPVYAFLTRMLEGAIETPSARAGQRGIALPPAFDAWFARATSPSPGDRFERASTQVTALATALGTAAPHFLRAARASSESLPPPPGLATPQGSGSTAQLTQPLPPAAVASPSHTETLRTSALLAGTTGPLSRDPIPRTPVSRRPRIVLTVAGVAAAAAAGFFGVARALQAPSGGQAAAAVTSASTATPPPPLPAALSLTPAVTATLAPTVEPAGAPRASASESPPSTAPTARKKKPSTAPTPPGPSSAAPNCNPPFTLDANGFKHAKPECL